MKYPTISVHHIENMTKSHKMLTNHPNFNPPLNFLELSNDHVLKSGNKTANVNYRKLHFIHKVNGD